jgi:predicted HicB family RNase H-like nuclease
MSNYKGYRGQLEIDEDADLIFGRVLDIHDVVTFKGETIAEAKQAFQDSVDDYLEFCQMTGTESDEPIQNTQNGGK